MTFVDFLNVTSIVKSYRSISTKSTSTTRSSIKSNASRIAPYKESVDNTLQKFYNFCRSSKKIVPLNDKNNIFTESKVISNTPICDGTPYLTPVETPNNSFYENPYDDFSRISYDESSRRKATKKVNNFFLNNTNSDDFTCDLLYKDDSFDIYDDDYSNTIKRKPRNKKNLLYNKKIFDPENNDPTDDRNLYNNNEFLKNYDALYGVIN